MGEPPLPTCSRTGFWHNQDAKVSVGSLQFRVLHENRKPEHVTDRGGLFLWKRAVGAGGLPKTLTYWSWNFRVCCFLKSEWSQKYRGWLLTEFSSQMPLEMFQALVGPSALLLLLSPKVSLRLLVIKVLAVWDRSQFQAGQPYSCFLSPAPTQVWTLCLPSELLRMNPARVSAALLQNTIAEFSPPVKFWTTTGSYGSYIAGWSRIESGQWSK